MDEARRRPRLSRRDFLARAATLGAAPWFVPARALGLGESEGANARIGVGLIGTGSRGMAHLRQLLGNGGVQVTAVCDPFRSKREAARRQTEGRYAEAVRAGSYKGCGAHADFRALLARKDVDAVFISSPEHWHALHTALAVEAGKDVYCEKAMTLTAAEGRAVCEAVRRHRRVFQLGTQQRSRSSFRLACELARNGYLGRIHTVEVGVPGGRSLPDVPPSPAPPGLDYELWLGPAPRTPYNRIKCSFDWYFMYDYCIGWIGSWGVHHIDIAQWGTPAFVADRIQVEGTAEFPRAGLANTSTRWRVRFTTPEGTALSFRDNSGHPQGCRFVGEEGYIHVNRGGISAQPASLLKLRPRPSDEHLHVSRNHHADFLECVRSRRDPVSPVESGHTATLLTIIADIATRVGRSLTWDWRAERFVGDEGANRFLGRPLRSPWRL
jgi:predicted dehydrogenase